MKLSNNFFTKLVFAFCLLFLTGCSSFAETGAPYQISGEMVIEDSSSYENAGFEFEFFNRTEKTVTSITIVFYLFDEDGNSPLLGKNNIVLQIDEPIAPMDSLESVVSIDKFIALVPDEPYQTDFLYVSKIVYSDGTQWKDSFGMYAF